MGLDDDIAILSAAPVFGFFDSGALRLLSFAGERLALDAGETLFKRGDRADGGYVVLSGAIELKGQGGTPIVAGRSALIGRTALFTSFGAFSGNRAGRRGTVLASPARR